LTRGSHFVRKYCIYIKYFLHHSLLTNLDFQLSPESKGELILDYNVSGRIL
jgi:hypothetical protein